MCSIPRPPRRARAPLWQRFAAETVDGALEIACRVAWRVLDGWATPAESAPKLSVRLRTALREVLGPRRPHDQTAPPQSPEGFKEFLEGLPKSFLRRVGRDNQWSAERALSRLGPATIFRVGPMILTGGQTPGQALLGLRVVRSDGRPITVLRALVREFGFVALAVPLDLLPLPHAARGAAKLGLLPLIPAVRFLDVDRRSPGDVLAGTRVVRTT